MEVQPPIRMENTQWAGEKRNLLLGQRGTVLHLTHETQLKGFFLSSLSPLQGEVTKI